jgi:hypothetical protein
LRYDLIQRGFLPHAAEAIGAAFRRSAEYAKVFQQEPGPSRPVAEEEAADPDATDASMGGNLSAPRQPDSQLAPSRPARRPQSAPATPPTVFVGPEAEEHGHDRIPVRLPGGRRAWLVIPATFYEADKQRLKAQIDLRLTEDE